MKKNLRFALAASAMTLTAVSFDASAQWTQIHHLPFNTGCWVTSEGNLLISDQTDDLSGGIYFSADKGQTWELCDIRDYNYSRFCEFGGYVYALGYSCRIARSADGGRNWEMLNYTSTVMDVYEPAMLRATAAYGMAQLGDKLYVADYGGQVIVSDDWGETWSLTPSEPRKISVSGELLDDNNYALAAMDNRLYLFGLYSVHTFTEEGGWVAAPVNSNCMASVVVADGTLYGGRATMNEDMNTPFLMATTDGIEWTGIPHPTGHVDCNVRGIDYVDGRIVTVSPMGFSYSTGDDGRHWARHIGIPMDCYPLVVCHDDEYVYASVFSPEAGNPGAGLYRMSIAGMNEMAQASAEIVATTPDVFVTESAIEVPSADAAISVWNAAGVCVKSAAATRSLDIAGLAPGVYIYRVATESATATGKFCK